MAWGGVSLRQQRGHCGWSKVNDRNSGRNELCQVMGEGVLQIPQRIKVRWCATGRFFTVDWPNSQFILERITLALGVRIDNREARVKVGRSAGRWLLRSKWEVMESWPWEVMWRWWEMSRLQIYFEARVRVCGGASQVTLVVKNLPANARDVRNLGSVPGSGRSPGKARHPTPVFLLGESHE